MFLIVLVGVASDQRPDRIVVFAPRQRGVQSLLAHGLDRCGHTLVQGAKGSKDISERAIFVLLVEAFVDLILSGKSRHELWRLFAVQNSLELVQQVALPGSEMGDIVFDRPGAIDLRYSHLFFAQGEQKAFEPVVFDLYVVEQLSLFYDFWHCSTSRIMSLFSTCLMRQLVSF